eukprot:5292064-Pleurochrysis_carterae.AAC.1
MSQRRAPASRTHGDEPRWRYSPRARSTPASKGRRRGCRCIFCPAHVAKNKTYDDGVDGDCDGHGGDNGEGGGIAGYKGGHGGDSD